MIKDNFDQLCASFFKDFEKYDHLGKAASAGNKARAAVKAADYNLAWRLYHGQKEHYLRHASRNQFTRAQTLALDACVSQDLANILRLEGKHDDALVHILYWICTSETPTKTQQQKLIAYFNRCKFKGVSHLDLHATVEILCKNPEFIQTRNAVSRWRSIS